MKNRYRYFINPVELSKYIMQNYVGKDMVVADCTVGNGNDTLLLSNLVGENGKVFGFDIQKEALEKTRDKLEKEASYYENTRLILDGHENIDQYIKEKIDFSIYNFGYLPGGNKDIITLWENSIISIGKSLKLLKNNGLLLATCYTGHSGGLEEKLKIEDLLSNLSQSEYNVLEFNFKNQKHCPPILYGIEKK